MDSEILSYLSSFISLEISEQVDVQCTISIYCGINKQIYFISFIDALYFFKSEFGPVFLLLAIHNKRQTFLHYCVMLPVVMNLFL